MKSFIISAILFGLAVSYLNGLATEAAHQAEMKHALAEYMKPKPANEIQNEADKKYCEANNMKWLLVGDAPPHIVCLSN